MSNLLENIWSFETKNLLIRVDALVEHDSDLSWDETGEVIAKLKSGEYQEFCARATVTDKKTGDELASDYLGNCIYSDISNFRDHVGLNTKSQVDGHSYGSYFSDMVRTVCSEAREAIKLRANHYKLLIA